MLFKKASFLIDVLLSIPKSLVFNCKYFTLSVACKLPILVSHRTVLSELQGRVFIDESKITFAMVKIGFGDVAIFDRRRSYAVWKNKGDVAFKGKAEIGHGSKLAIGSGGLLTLGKKFKISAESSLICRKKIEFGDDCLLSWDVLVMDSDFHAIVDDSMTHINQDQAVIFGKNVWVGCRSMIKKGINVADGSIIAAQSVVVKNIKDENQIWGGNPARLLKEGVHWH